MRKSDVSTDGTAFVEVRPFVAPVRLSRDSISRHILRSLASSPIRRYASSGLLQLRTPEFLFPPRSRLWLGRVPYSTPCAVFGVRRCRSLVRRCDRKPIVRRFRLSIYKNRQPIPPDTLHPWRSSPDWRHGPPARPADLPESA